MQMVQTNWGKNELSEIGTPEYRGFATQMFFYLGGCPLMQPHMGLQRIKPHLISGC
jgi:hypothetical protein